MLSTSGTTISTRDWPLALPLSTPARPQLMRLIRSSARFSYDFSGSQRWARQASVVGHKKRAGKARSMASTPPCFGRPADMSVGSPALADAAVLCMRFGFSDRRGGAHHGSSVHHQLLHDAGMACKNGFPLQLAHHIRNMNVCTAKIWRPAKRPRFPGGFPLNIPPKKITPSKKTKGTPSTAPRLPFKKPRGYPQRASDQRPKTASAGRQVQRGVAQVALRRRVRLVCVVFVFSFFSKLLAKEICGKTAQMHECD